MFNTDMAIGDEVLQEVLGQQADIQMKSIVATIQKNRIRSFGTKRAAFNCSGSGWQRKNVGGIAAGRIFAVPRPRADRVEPDAAILSKPAFNSYVANVLPELGEENIQQTTFQEFVARRLGKQVPCETPFDQLEYCLTASDGEEQRIRMKSIELKSSLAFKGIIDDYVKYLAKGHLVFKHITFRGKGSSQAVRCGNFSRPLIIQTRCPTGLNKRENGCCSS